MIWYKIASRLGKTLQECQEETTSTEFVEWAVLLEQEQWHENSKFDYYLASIVRELRQIQQMFAKNPRVIPIEECLLSFKTATEDKQTSNQHPKLQPVKPGEEAMADPAWVEKTAKLKESWAKIMEMKAGSRPNAGHSSNPPT